MEHRAITPGFVEDALTCLASRGLDPAPLLAAAGLPQRVASPITSDQYGRLWQVMAAATGDEFFGLAARPMPPGSFTLMCHAVLHARTLDRALARALRFLNVVLEDPSGRIETAGGQAIVILTDHDGPRPAFAYRTYWLILMGLSCWLVGRRIALRRLDFSCPAPPQRDDYRQFFGAPVHFDRPKTQLVFDAGYLSLPIRRSEAALKTFLRGAPANILLRYRHDEGMTSLVRNRLHAIAPADRPGFDALAAALGLSPATLRRRLAAEGQGYAEIRETLLQEDALRLLRSGDLTVAETAERLGYSEPGAFHRAFRRWTGQSPGAVRLAASRGRRLETGAVAKADT